MKKLKTFFLLGTFFLISSCQTYKGPEPESKYKKGDIVHIKPDSTVAVVTYLPTTDNKYFYVSYMTVLGERKDVLVHIEEIY